MRNICPYCNKQVETRGENKMFLHFKANHPEVQIKQVRVEGHTRLVCLICERMLDYRSAKHHVHIAYPEVSTLPPISSETPTSLKAPASFEELIALVPDIPTLGALVVSGFMKLLQDRDDQTALVATKLAQLQKLHHEVVQELEAQTKARIKVEKVYADLHNSVLASKRLSHLTIDQVHHKIIQKPQE